jgi:hypothetical protein
MLNLNFKNLLVHGSYNLDHSRKELPPALALNAALLFLENSFQGSVI